VSRKAKCVGIIWSAVNFAAVVLQRKICVSQSLSEWILKLQVHVDFCSIFRISAIQINLQKMLACIAGKKEFDAYSGRRLFSCLHMHTDNAM